MLTIAEIAKRHGLPESTARYYCKRFRDFLPHVGEGKRRRFLPEALPVFETLLKAMEEKKNADSVEEILEAQFSRIGSTKRKNSSTPLHESHVPLVLDALEPLLQRQTRALEDIAAVLHTLLGHREQVDSSQNDQAIKLQLQELEKRMASLQQHVSHEIRNLSSMQDQAERIYQQDIEQLRKWLGHLAREQAREHEREGQG